MGGREAPHYCVTDLGKNDSSFTDSERSYSYYRSICGSPQAISEMNSLLNTDWDLD